MQRLRILAAFIVVLSVLAMSGCDPKTWHVDFTTVADLDDWNASGPYLLNEENVVGLWLDNFDWIVAPVVFKGNFDLSLEFTLLGYATGEGNLEVGFSGEEGDIHETAVWLDMIKSTGMSLDYGAYEIDTDDDDIYHYLYDDTDVIAGLIADGQYVNTLLVNKVGDHFKVYINDVFLFEYNQGSYYDSDYYCPWLWVGYFSNVDDWIVFKSIHVDYWGTKMDI